MGLRGICDKKCVLGLKGQKGIFQLCLAQDERRPYHPPEFIRIPEFKKRFSLKFGTKLAASIALASVLVPVPVATSAENSQNEVQQSTNTGTGNDVLKERIAKAQEEQQALLVINDANESGYSAEVVNGNVHKEADAVVVESPNGKEEALPTSKTLITGEKVNIEYSVEGNQIAAKYSTNVDPELVDATLIQTRSAAGCAGAVLLGGAATVGSAVEVASAPLTGPIGPTMAAVTMANASGSIITAADQCG
ncbi:MULTISPECIES: hypothetical protein [unclassified Corynebacterium]|uniref:hypothetical protein n=1 Tax=unclassified Corynebacterium TaxID=2624378 RepID=UPI001EF44BE5|nr:MULTISPECIES: hypothetical protein [unclassified Corynebacterium]MCG7233283.1 hypothetical protein [Corynebacterium sp. ACRPR]MCG7244094.1 hypothetical protein [Corynebacterium sp. ACRPS]MCG7271310.1 hypothetical protein [Corynebacterium sp. ACRQM]MDK8474366.1 hypothetical protein [Corynebacterium sp. MSK078]MDK8659763.1 hypothetical protein [Corynebacterium sp. MSK204]